MSQETLDAFGADGNDGLGTIYAFDPDGARCDRCRTVVTERWTDERGSLICLDCKQW